MTRKSKKYQLLVSALLLCFLQVAGIDVYAQSTVTPARKDTTIIQREAPKARARRHRDPIIQDSVKKDSIQISQQERAEKDRATCLHCCNDRHCAATCSRY